MTREEATEILKRHDVDPSNDTLPPLGGSQRARVRTALNWLRRNPESKPKRKRAKKAAE